MGEMATFIKQQDLHKPSQIVKETSQPLGCDKETSEVADETSQFADETSQASRKNGLKIKMLQVVCNAGYLQRCSSQKDKG